MAGAVAARHGILQRAGILEIVLAVGTTIHRRLRATDSRQNGVAHLVVDPVAEMPGIRIDGLAIGLAQPGLLPRRRRELEIPPLAIAQNAGVGARGRQGTLRPAPRASG